MRRLLGASPPFSMRRLANLSFWFDASDATTLYQDSLLTLPITSDSLPVGAWLDKSGNNRHLLQATASKRLTYSATGLNGRPCLRSDGVDDRLVSSGWSLSQPNTVFLVGRYDVLTANQSIIDGTASPGRHLAFITGSPPHYAFVAGSSMVSTTDADANPHIHTVVVNGATSLYRVDGTQITTGNPGTDSFTGITLAGSYFGSSYTVTVSEIIAYNRVLTDPQIKQVESALKRKWGTA